MSHTSKDTLTKRAKLFSQIAVWSNAVILLVAPVIILLLIGLWLDRTLHTTPIFIITGVIAGFLGSIVNVYRLSKKI